MHFLIAANGARAGLSFASDCKARSFPQKSAGSGEGALLFVVGLFVDWPPKDDPDVECSEACAVLTRKTSRAAQLVHDRNPVIPTESAYSAWLGRAKTNSAAVAEMLLAAVTEGFRHCPVFTLVNSPKKDRPVCTTAIEASVAAAAGVQRSNDASMRHQCS